MQGRFVREFVDGARVDAAYVLRSREMRSTRTGDAYLALEISDRTGSLPAVYFRPRPEAVSVPVGSVVRISGLVTTFRGVRRVSVERLEPAETWDPSDLVARGTRPIGESDAAFSRLAASVTDSSLRRVVRAVFADKEFYRRFRECPASQSYHHAYLGGLIEHTVSVATICASLAEDYEGVDRDLLVTAALLHDIGKVDELTFSAGISYSDEGRLVGHVVSTAMRIRTAASGGGVDPSVLLRLEHAVLSHHGELEWGSPKRPSTFEALLLHHVDNLDAKAAGFSALVKGAALVEEEWTDSSNLFRRPLYAPRPIEDDRPARDDEDGQHFRRSA